MLSRGPGGGGGHVLRSYDRKYGYWLVLIASSNITTYNSTRELLSILWLELLRLTLLL